MSPNRRPLYLLTAFVVGAFLGVVAWTYSDSADGIYPTPTGEGLYLQGESCTINMEPDDIDVFALSRMENDFLHCATYHLCHYGEIGQLFPSPTQCVSRIQSAATAQQVDPNSVL